MKDNLKGEISTKSSDDISASVMLLTAISDFAVSKKDIHFTAKYLEISEKATSFVYQMSGEFTCMLADYMNNRTVATIDVDYSRALEVADEVRTFDLAALSNAAASFESMLTDTPFAERHYKYQMTTQLGLHIGQALSQVSDLSCGKPLDKVIPKSLIKALSNMSLLQKNIFYKGCYLNKVAKLKIDSEAFDHCINGFRPRAESLKFCLDLVKCGANYAFVNSYNNCVDVDYKKVMEWRDIYGVSNDKQVMTHRHISDLWTMYHELLKQDFPRSNKMCDIYFHMFHKFKGKYRLDTLYNQLQDSLEEERTIDSDEDDIDDNAIVNLLS